MIAFYLEKLPHLTYREIRFLDFIGERIAGGLPPSVREMAAKFNYSNPNGAQYFFKQLKRKKLIERAPGFLGSKKSGSRSLRLINCKWFPLDLKV